MKTVHLTENQLNAYSGDSALSAAVKHEIGRHLLQCEFCLKRLPPPTGEQFRAALMIDDAAEVEAMFDERSTWTAPLALFFESLKHPKMLALSAALAILIISLGFIWRAAAAPSSETENVIAENVIAENVIAENVIAENFNPAPPVFGRSSTGEQISSPPPAAALPVVKTGDSSLPAATAPKSSPRRQLPETKYTRKLVPNGASRNNSNPGTADSERAIVSSIRGGTSALANCGNEIEMITGTSGEAVTLKWKKRPKAAKYHLYISDEEEILLDEFETAQATSYVLTMPLDPRKTYQWKLVVTLENGDLVIADSQKFTIKDFKSNQKKSAKKAKSEIRCSDDK